MSENTSENSLNEEIVVTVDDAPAITVNTPLVENLTADNAAPTAKTVGDALAQKVDTADIMQHVTITFDGIDSDNQGVLLISAEDIPVTDSTTIDPETGDGSIKGALDDLDAKTAADINYTALGGQTIKDKVDELAGEAADIRADMRGDLIPIDDAAGAGSVKAAIGAVEGKLYADQIPMASGDATKISAKISAVEGKLYADQIPMASGDATKISSAIGTVSTNLSTLSSETVKTIVNQGLNTDQRQNARDNIGLGSAATKNVYNELDQSEEGYVLDARKGSALNTAIAAVDARVTTLGNKWTKQDISSQISWGNEDSGNKAAIQTGTLHCYKIGCLCHLELGIKFSAAQSANCQAWKGNFYGLPAPIGGVRAICGTAVYSNFVITMASDGDTNIRFVHLGTNASTSNTYMLYVEYIINESSGGEDEGGEGD